jgi:hypothetical protein
MSIYSYILNMYILGGQVYEDEEIMMTYEYNSIYEQNPDEYIVEVSDGDCDYINENEHVSLSFEFMEKMKLTPSLHFS